MSFRVAAWNVKGALASSRADKIIEVVKKIDADVFVFPEAYSSSKFVSPSMNEYLRASLYNLGALGYHAAYSSYNDIYDHPAKRGLVYASRLGDTGRFTYLGEHNQAHSFVTDPDTNAEVEFWGVHLDERSDEKRLQAIEDLPDCHSQNVVMVGDFNAMPGCNRKERLIGSQAVQLVARSVSHERLRDVSIRLNDMASGDTVRALGLKGLYDVGYQTTWPSSLPLAQLDHIMVSDSIKAGKFEVGSSDQAKLSDHRSVSAVIFT